MRAFSSTPRFREPTGSRFLHTYLDAGADFQVNWKSWWEMVSRATAAKVAKNRRNGRTLG